jgi:hypothetical protein
VTIGAAKSNREARTLLEQKSVKLFGSPFTPEIEEKWKTQPVQFGTTAALPVGEYRMKIGKARFIKLTITP